MSVVGWITVLLLEDSLRAQEVKLAYKAFTFWCDSMIRLAYKEDIYRNVNCAHRPLNMLKGLSIADRPLTRCTL